MNGFLNTQAGSDLIIALTCPSVVCPSVVSSVVSVGSFDQFGVGEDFGPEVTAALSSRDFMKENEDWFAGFFGKGEGDIVITEPVHGADLHWCGGEIAGQEGKKEEDAKHGAGGKNKRLILKG